MNSARSLTGLLRKSFIQSRGFKVSSNPVFPKDVMQCMKIFSRPTSCCWVPMKQFKPSLDLSLLFNSEVVFFSSVTSPDLSQKELNTDSSTESSMGNKGEEPVDPVNQKQPGSVGKAEAVKRARAEPKNNVKKNESESDSDEDMELTTEDLIQLVEEKEELLKVKHKEIQTMQEKVLRSYAEVENVMDRTRRDAENSKKFAIQSFAKSLLDVADNLGRASSVAKESFSKLDASKDSNGAAALLKTLLEGVEMTEKQLSDVFKKYGIERFDPIDEQFDPHRHMAVFQFPDASKEAGTVGAVLKPGYILHDRIIRPAEVGVVEAVQTEAVEVSEHSEPEDSTKPGYILHDRIIRPAEVSVVEAVQTEAVEVSKHSEPADSTKVSS